MQSASQNAGSAGSVDRPAMATDAETLRLAILVEADAQPAQRAGRPVDRERGSSVQAM